MQKYRGVISGISKEEKPQSTNGWTFFETDTGIAYLMVNGEWVVDKENPFIKLFPKVKA